jgi:mannose-6-phosphate isomerase-like protein (cupin superfamily)
VGQSVTIPLGTAHRLENPGKVPLVMIETQIGKNLLDLDIERLQDDYEHD